MRVLVVSNAAAARARRGIAVLREALAEGRAGAAPQAPTTHHVTERAAQVDALVGHDGWRPDDLLVINGGDGSVQHALTVLLAHCPPERLPRLACLPGGTTNMTAHDLNAHRRFGQCAETLRRAVAGQLPAAPRRVVRVQADTGPARCGLFFGIGTIVQGIEYFQARIRHNGGAHELGAGAALVRTLWGIARHQPPFAQPLTVRLLAGGNEAFAAAGPLSVRLLLATTLDRLFLGMRPYWGSGPGALKATLVESRAPAFVTRVPRLLRGRPDRHMTARLGYHSARLDALTLTFAGSYTLDGELFGHADDTMGVSATVPLRFLPL